MLDNLTNRLAGIVKTLRGQSRFTEDNIAEALRAGGDLIGHVHFADSNRHAIGFGHTDIAPIIEALRDINYQGYLSAEILPLPDSATAAQKTRQSFRHYIP